MTKIRVILFEDIKVYRESMEDYFKDSDTVYLAATFPNADNAIQAVREYNPDVILMDIQMPGISGIDALRQIIQANPNSKIMMLTSFDEDDKIFAAVCSGASGYALKSVDPDDLEKGIGQVHNGGGFMSPTVAAKVMRMFQNQIVTSQPHYVDLTPRQKDVLKCMVDGLSYKMTAAQLDLTNNTVNDHIKAIYKKLHVNSAPEAVREAILRKLV